MPHSQEVTVRLKRTPARAQMTMTHRWQPRTGVVMLLALKLHSSLLYAHVAASEQPAASALGNKTSTDEVARLYLTSPGRWPEPWGTDGAYQYVLNDRALHKGLYVPNADRIRRVLNKLRQGQNITISTIGGSVTAGQGAVDAPSWPKWLSHQMDRMFGVGRVTVSNGAVPGTISSYMVVCMNIHVPKDADIVFVEYNQNDHANVGFAHAQRRSYERLLRKLLSLPNQPAVIIMNSFSYTMPTAPVGLFWHSSERDYHELALYYGLPTISTKGAVYHLMAANISGFSPTPRNRNVEGLKNVSFNFDIVHPDGNTGYRCMFELALSLLNNTLTSLDQRPFTAEEENAATAQLPPPMIPNNYPSVSDRCFIGSHFTDIVSGTKGFEWKDDSKKGGVLKKFGMIATKPGSSLELTLDTTATATAQVPVEEGHLFIVRDRSQDTEWQRLQNMVQVELAHLVSYANMGKANVTCVSGCQCPPVVLNGHTTHKSSQLTTFSFYVTQSEKCKIRVEVLQSTDSQAHKVKITGLMLSEEAGRHRSIGTGHGLAGTVDYVHSITFRSKDSLFDISNHAKRRLLRRKLKARLRKT